MNNDINRARFNSDDPLLTAYALGELDAAEAAEFERRLAADAALRDEVAAIRATGSSLREGFAAEPVATLTESQRLRIMRPPVPAAALRAAAEPRAVLNSPRIFALRSRWVGAGLAAAAVIALTLTAAIMFNNGRQSNDYARSSGQAAAEGGRQNMASADTAARMETLQRELAVKDELQKEVLEGARARNEAGAMALSAGSETGPGRTSEAAPPAPATPQQAPALAPGAADPRPTGGVISTTGGALGGGGRGGAAAAPGISSGEAERDTDRRREAAPGQDPPARPKPASTPEPAAGAKPAETAPFDDRAAGGLVQQPAAPADQRDDKAPASSTATGLRNPAQEHAADREAAVQLLSEEQIAQMEKPEVRSALLQTEQWRSDATVDNTRRQLFRQAEHLRERLRQIEVQDAEEYSRINDNPFIKAEGKAALSTFAADVDTASYSNIRRFLDGGALPPADAVRIEEMVNYFRYDYEPPTAADGAAPFKANVEIAPAPWNPEHRLVRIGLRGMEMRMDMRPATSLVFLVDVSGSMNNPAKLPLVKHALNRLVRQLNGDDRLAIVTYAGNAGLVLDSCYVNATNRERIDAAIETMTPGGSTNGAGGINLAYQVAREHFIKGGVNRVILCTDGDFNVGVSSADALVQLITEQRTSNVFLSVLGFGTGNLQEGKMEKLADAGNGNFAYIDSRDEAEKVLVKEMGSTLVTIAKDVKFQVEFNPTKVGAYRLIGYENRLLAAEDFNNDAKDAGEIGSGHTMTALYEVVPAGKEVEALALNEPAGEIDELEFQKPAPPAGAAGGAAGADLSDDLLLLKVRYKEPEGDKSSLLRFTVKDEGKAINDASDDFRFASAVAEFGMLLRRSPYKSGATFEHVLAMAEGGLGEDREGYRAQFMDLVRKAQKLERGGE